MMVTAYSIVVRNPPSAAVLCSALVSSALILGASSPIDLASIRIGTTRATTTSTMTPPIVKPSTQPKLLKWLGANVKMAECMSLSFPADSDRLAEVPDRLQARVDRGQPVGHGAGQLRDGTDAAGDLAQRRQGGPEVEYDAQQANRGDRDYQRGDDQRAPGSCRHDSCSFPLSRADARRTRRTGPRRSTQR